MFLLRVIYRLVYISYVSFVLLSKKINTGVIFLYLCPSVYKTSSGEVFLHLLSLCLKKNILSSSNPLGLQPLPLYFPCGKHMGRKDYFLSVGHSTKKSIAPVWLLRHMVGQCSPLYIYAV